MKKATSWKELTLRQKIGQTVICLCEREKHIAMCGSIQAFLEKYPIGGMFNNGGIVKGLLTGETMGFQAVLDEYNQYLPVPLIGTADRGAYAAQYGLTPPPQMALGAANDEELACKIGEYMAMDCRMSGVHWLFWPVCDLSISDRSPINDTRSVGDDPDLVTKIVGAELRAMEDMGIISTLKHYPGTPYDDAIDPHLTPVSNKTPMALWRETYGKMYRDLIEQGAPTIMTGHVNLEDYQQTQVDGLYPSATMSYELTTKLLRQELGFKGVAVTDALVMGGFTGENAVENTVRSFLAGNDMLLWPAYEYIDRMEERILSGQIDEALLDAAVERIWNLKEKYGVLSGKKHLGEADVMFFETRVAEVAEKSLTLVQDHHLLPMKQEEVKNVLVIGVTPDDGQYEQLCGLKTEFEKYGCHVTMRRNISPEEIQMDQEMADFCLFALCRTPHRPIGLLDFWGEEAISIWASNCADKTKTVVASFGTPYLYKYYRNSGVTYINAYTCAQQTIEAFVRALFGQIPFTGASPVKLIKE